VVGNQELTLDDIENVILRFVFWSAIHFTLSSANGGVLPYCQQLRK
jgi:hypothetical protein